MPRLEEESSTLEVALRRTERASEKRARRKGSGTTSTTGEIESLNQASLQGDDLGVVKGMSK